MSGEAIRHRITSGRLHRLMRGVYAVGWPDLTDRGRWMAAVLACGPHALLSHRSAAALLDLRKERRNEPVEVVVPAHVARRRSGIRVYRRAEPSLTEPRAPHAGGRSLDPLRPLPGLTEPRSPHVVGRSPDPLRPRLVENIPVTGPAVTFVDLSTCLPTGQLEAAINEADHLELIDPEALRAAIDELPRRPGVRRLRTLLDTASHTLTTTALERHFLPLAADAGLPIPETQARPGSHRVDFYWAELRLIVETDSLRYHRTPFKQAADKRRDNAHARSGLVTLRFTHGQVHYEPNYVRAELRAVARRIAEASTNAKT